MLALLRSLTPTVRGVIGIAFLVAIVSLMLFLDRCSAERTAKTEAKLSENQAEAAFESGTDAVETVGRVTEYERHVDYITRENSRAILESPGADAPVDPSLARTARERLCGRPAYSKHPDCLLYALTE
jgi:hypothetical protein